MLQVGALAARHQGQRRLAVEMEMPEIAHQPHVAPVPHPRQEGIHQGDAIHLRGMLCRIGIGHHQADIVADDANALQTEALHQGANILGHDGLGVAIGRRRGFADAAQVRSDDRAAPGQLGDQRQPHMAGLRIAMKQHHWIALAGDQIMQPDAIRLGEAALRGLGGSRRRGVRHRPRLHRSGAGNRLEP